MKKLNFFPFSERILPHCEIILSGVDFGKVSQTRIGIIRNHDLVNLQVKRAKFVSILFLALAVRFNTVVNICHLLRY
jgi:hypothetical protein